MMKASELRDKPVEELEAILRETRSEMFEQSTALQQTKKPELADKMKILKKDIARILTVLRQKELAEKTS